MIIKFIDIYFAHIQFKDSLYIYIDINEIKKLSIDICVKKLYKSLITLGAFR